MPWYPKGLQHAWDVGGHIVDWPHEHITALARLRNAQPRLPAEITAAQRQLDRSRLVDELTIEQFGDPYRGGY